MFEQAVLAAPPSHRLFGTFAGVTCQAMFVATLIVIPMVFPEVLPGVKSMVTLVPPGPPPPPPGGTTVRPHQTMKATRAFCSTCAPVSIPRHVTILVDDTPPEVAAGPGVMGMEAFGAGGGGGNGPGVLGSILRDLPTMVPVAPAPQVVKPKPQPIAAEPQRVPGGVVKMANPIHRVEPVYPPLAKQARVSGSVEIEAVIGVDGRLREIRVKSGHPLLVKAAVDAVRQWIYEPTTLNGVPVEVAGVILVTFRLN